MRDRPIYYTFDGPVEDVIEWAKWFEEHGDDRVIARTRHKERGREFVLSTVFLGLDHQWGDGPPILYETMVFDLQRPAWNAVVASDIDGNEMDRYQSRAEAEAGHDPWRMTGH